MATATPFGITPPPLPSVPDLSQYVSTASNLLKSTGQADAETATQNAILNQGKVALEGSQATVQGLQQQQTTLQKTYSDLASEFKVEEQQAQSQEQITGSANIGAAQVAAAKSGIDPSAGGAFAAPVTAAKQDMQAKIQDIATQYGAKEKDIADTLAGNLDQINSQIIQAQTSGNNAYAAVLTQVAQLKQQQTSEIASLAEQMQTAQTQYEQQAWKDYMDEVNAQHQQATLDLMAARLAQTAANEARTNAIAEERLAISEKNASGTLTFTNNGGDLQFFNSKTKQPVSLSSYLASNTPDGNVDPRAAVAFLQQHGQQDKATDISKAMAPYVEKYGISMVNGTADPNADLSKMSSSDFNSMMASLISKYPEVFGE